MSYEVLDVDLADLKAEQEVDLPLTPERDGAFVLMRYHTRPVGSLFLDRNEIASEEKGGVRKRLENAAGAPLVRARVQAELNWSDALPVPQNTAVTVAICTRERPDDLRRALQSLMHLQGDGHELLVIDNNPRTDATSAVVGEFAPHVRYVREDTPGLNAARNRALREARHEIVAFNDDDAEPDPTWLVNLIRNFDDPRVLCVTGLVMPRELETPSQVLFEQYSPFGRGFTRRVFAGPTVDPLAVSPVGAGASMAVRRTLPGLVGEFDEALDAGTPTRSGGDHEMFFRILAHGYSIVYDPEAVSRHRHRRTMEELIDTFYGYGVGVYAYWSRCLLREGEWRVLLYASNWLVRYQLPEIVRAASGQTGLVPLPLALAQLRGCLRGPWAYLRSYRRQEQRAT